MNTVITALHCDIPEELKTRAGAIVERLGQFASRAMECTVVFETDHNTAIAEVRLHLPQRKLLVARGEGIDHRTALDRAEEKLRNQLDKASLRPRGRAKADQA
ncbi:MAG: HPF/RaiA family ribosome-associated protein [Gemmatimonadota bacterium]